jgi:hypothetical protein
MNGLSSGNQLMTQDWVTNRGVKYIYDFHK